MNSRLSYFALNRLSGFARGASEGISFSGGRFLLQPGSRGRFLSRILDSGEADTQWHRLCLRADSSDGLPFRITVYASNDTERLENGTLVSLSSVISDSGRSMDEKLGFCRPYLRKTAEGQCDFLLHDISGRYLWILLEGFNQGTEEAGFRDVMIYLPRVSWMDYLPAVYRNADSKSAFLERYLALFQTLYEDLNRQIGSSALLFDPCAGPADFLRWTASWFGERDLSIWPEEKLRRFLPQAVELYRRRGTARSILDLLELYTGERPFLVENAKLKRFRGAGEFHSIYAPLYGENSWEFTVLIREKYLRSPGERGALLKLIEEMKPAQTSVRLVALRPCIFAGQYSYLGVNSVLSRYKPLAIDGSSQFSMTAIGGGDSRPQ